MPKATLEFQLPKEQQEFKRATQAMNMYCTLWDIQQECRRMMKHGDPTVDQLIKVLDDIRQMAAEFEQ